MSQYIAGTVNVIVTDATVTGVGTEFLTYVSAGDTFTKLGSSVVYEVGSITDDTHLELTSNYAGATESGIDYVIQSSFTPVLGIAYPEQEDLDTATTMKRAMLKIEALLTGAADLGDLVIPAGKTLSGAGAINITGGLTTGPGLINGAGASSGSNALRVYNSAATLLLNVNDAGEVDIARAAVNGDYGALSLTNPSAGASARTLMELGAGTQAVYLILNGSGGDKQFQIINRTGGVYLADAATAWTAISDERKKNIFEPIADAVSKVCSLRAVIGAYKSDIDQKRHAFLIAQDVLKVLPEAVDAAQPGDLGLTYTAVIPLLVAAITELAVSRGHDGS